MILNGLHWKQTEIILLFLRLHPSNAFPTLVDCEGYSIPSKGFLATVVDIVVICVKFHSTSIHLLLLLLARQCQMKGFFQSNRQCPQGDYRVIGKTAKETKNDDTQVG